ncbi:MAG: UbiA family prenyltransferase [Bacteroidia bacterium]
MKNTFILLRLPFSYFLMPVYFFALSEAHTISVTRAILVFIVLHLLIFPSSNAYNSYMDQDEGPIGGLKNPPKATRQLYHAANILDALALLIAGFINLPFLAGTLIYILSSRAYSYKGIRLKKYPIAGFLIVALVQGGITFLAVVAGISNVPFSANEGIALLPAAAASALLLGGVYPLTQIFQHEEDKKSGDISISILLGYTGTFLFSALLFISANAILFFYYNSQNDLRPFSLLQLFLLPTVLFFVYWFIRVFKDTAQASFENTMRMNIISATCMNACFITCTFLY